MKKLFTLFVTTWCCGVVFGQIATWLIPPIYDGISFNKDYNLVITDSVGSTVLWNLQGERLASTSDDLLPFSEGFAVTRKKESVDISGFYDFKGNFIPLDGCQTVPWGEAVFSYGLLLVKCEDAFRFVNSKGKFLTGNYVNAYPFMNGYASCRTYRDKVRKKGLNYHLITPQDEEITFSYRGKTIETDEIDFISSVNCTNIGIVIINKRVYYFYGINKNLLPVTVKRDDFQGKTQVKIKDDFYNSITKSTDGTRYTLYAKYGKDDVQIKFDTNMVPFAVRTPEFEQIYDQTTIAEAPIQTTLQITRDGKYLGLAWSGNNVLPPQFEEVPLCVDDKAFVKLAGKYGMLKIYPNEKFRITINKGDNVAFRHQKYETIIRLDLPTILSSHGVRIEVAPMSGCDVDLTSEVQKDTQYGNYLQYDCILNIPEFLPDEMFDDERNEVIYPTQVFYNGLKSFPISYKIMAWHYKYFNVDVNDSEVIVDVDNGSVSFIFNIHAERNPGESVYPFRTEIVNDSLINCELEKISETRYKCRVFNLVEGNNNFKIQIIEQGCPAVSFPFEVTYHKPVLEITDEGQTIVTGSGKVELKKKTKVISTPKPHIEI